MTRRLLPILAFAVALMPAARPAHADVTRRVISAFRGHIIVTKGDLPEGKNDRDTIKRIRAANQKTLVGTAKGDITAWHFHYTAFLSRTGATQLRFQFITGKALHADKGIAGIDPKMKVLTGDLSMDEDEGLTKGKTYTVQLVNDKNAVVAKTTLTMK